MPEHTFIANELRGTCVGLRGGASIDLGRREEGRRRERLIGALFLGDQHLSSPAVHRPPSAPPSPRHRSLFPRKPGGRGGEGSVMNERHWRTPKAAISDPPPTTEHGQRDNKREREGKKRLKICHIPGLRNGDTVLELRAVFSVTALSPSSVRI